MITHRHCNNNQNAQSIKTHNLSHQREQNYAARRHNDVSLVFKLCPDIPRSHGRILHGRGPEALSACSHNTYNVHNNM